MASTEIDIRLFGMVVALAVIWLGFNILSGGDFLTARNLWNLSVQSASIAIMATGMVLIIVSRNIDLSVGSLLGFLGYTMAMVQTEWIPNTFDLGFDRWYTWIVALAVGIALGAAIGAVQGFIVAYVGVPSFIVTLGGILIWRGLIFRYAAGPDAGADGRQLPAARRRPARFARRVAQLAARRDRLRRSSSSASSSPAGAAAATSSPSVRSASTSGSAWSAVSSSSARSGSPTATPGRPQLASQYAERHGIVEPEGGLKIPTGVAYPVVILIGVALVMTYLARRRRFGRYVYAIGGNPEAAELGGINVRRTIMFTFVLMGVLCAVSAAVQTARLNAAVTGPRRAATSST